MATKANGKRATILTPSQVHTHRRPLSIVWRRAAGILRGKRKAMEQHIRRVRREWNT